MAKSAQKTPVYILGINGGTRPGYQDISAVLLRNGEVIAAVEEERLNRIKHSAGQLPLLAVAEVLKIANIQIRGVSLVAFHGNTWEKEIENVLSAHFKNYFGYSPPIKRYHHHDCHAASSFYASSFNNALVLTMDNSGDGVSLQISVGENGKLRQLERFFRPNSLGVFYSLITQYCGFTKDADEYKLMGLAAYGNPDAYNFDWLINFENGELKINTDYIFTVPERSPSLHRQQMMFNEKFINKLNHRSRLYAEPINDFYKDIAASAQRHLEKIVIEIVRFYFQKTGIKNVCTAGGVALNCIMSKALIASDVIENLFVSPASTDAGISLGAAWLASEETGIIPVAHKHVFLGTDFSNEEIEAVLSATKSNYAFIENPAKVAAEMIADAKVVGWFQEREEFGPRALGNRSILANPAIENIQAVVNQKIKFRESFRPFGASVIEEDASVFYNNVFASPYMNMAFSVKEKYAMTLRGVTHVDGSCRIQTVNEKQNKRFFELLKYLKEKTGTGVVLNTSFNLNYEPIVHTPQQALASFFGSGLDALFIGNYLVRK